LLTKDVHILQGIAVTVFMCGGKVYNSFVSNFVEMLDTKTYLNRLIFGQVIQQICVPGFLRQSEFYLL